MAKQSTITKQQELQSQREAIDVKLTALEEKAGILEATKKAHEGPLFPYGVFDKRPPLGTPAMEQEHILYFDDQHDYIRDHLRKAYFSVADVDLRRQLIGLQMERAKVIRWMGEHMVLEQRRDLQRAQEKAADYPWVGAAVMAIVAVAIGAYFFQLIGAIAGAVVGFFWGQASVATAKKQMASQVQQAEELLADTEKDGQEEALRPEFFSALEAATGEEDAHFAQESATFNRAQACART